MDHESVYDIQYELARIAKALEALHDLPDEIKALDGTLRFLRDEAERVAGAIEGIETKAARFVATLRSPEAAS